MAVTLAELAEKGLAWLKAQPGSFEAELYLARGEERSIERREGALDGIQQSATEGAGLRLLSKGRMGFASAGGLSLEAIQDLYRKALSQLAHVEPDAHKAFPKPAAAKADKALADSLWDESLFTESWDKLTPRLEAMEEQVRRADARVSSVLRLGYGESRGEVLLANTQGLVACERGGSASVGLSAMAGRDGEVQIGSAYQSSRRKDELNFHKVSLQAAERAVALLGSRKLPGGRRSVIIDPWIAGEFLGLVAELLCADEIQRGKSLLAGKKGQKVASELMTFIDDPRRVGGMASSLYDDEGCPTARKVMIEKGVVQDYFYDTYTANKDSRATNASAGRGSYKGLPGPGSSNFYLEPGTISREKLIEDTPDGILVLDVMGMHTADPVSGEFSVGVSGIAVERGKLTHPVKSAMISGNLVELLGRVDAVASDLTFYGGTGSPTFRIAHLTVA